MDPNTPPTPQGDAALINSDGSIDISWIKVPGAKSYIIHYGPPKDSDEKNAIFMEYSETNTFKLPASKVPVGSVQTGDLYYFWIQAYNELGVGATTEEKARYLHDGQFTGSAWSAAITAHVN